MLAFVCFLLDLLACIISGYAIEILWNWFVAPTFGIAHLTYSSGLGIGLIIAAASNQFIPTKEEQILERSIYNIITPIFILVIGLITHLAQ